MQTINAYLYPNIIEVQFLDLEIGLTRNRVVYTKPVKVYRGIDNKIQVLVKNQDQKVVDLYNYNVYLDIIDTEEKETVATYTLVFIERALGLGYFTITSSTLSEMPKRLYKIVMKTEKINPIEESLLYTDDNYSLGLDLEVNDGFYS